MLTVLSHFNLLNLSKYLWMNTLLLVCLLIGFVILFIHVLVSYFDPWKFYVLHLDPCNFCFGSAFVLALK